MTPIPGGMEWYCTRFQYTYYLKLSNYFFLELLLYFQAAVGEVTENFDKEELWYFKLPKFLGKRFLANNTTKGVFDLLIPQRVHNRIKERSKHSVCY